MHRTLNRQLRRECGIESDEELQALLEAAQKLSSQSGLPAELQSFLEGLQGFIDRVDSTYEQYDRDLDLRSRSLEMSSSELSSVNEKMRADIVSRNRVLASLREAAAALLEHNETGLQLPAEEDLEGLSALLPSLVKQQEASRLELFNQRFAMDQHAIVSITDTSGNILYVNDKFCLISGFSREELIGNNHRLINSHYHPLDFFSNLWQTITSGRVWHGQICNRSKAGEQYWVDATIVPFLDGDGQPYQYIAIRTEITESKRMAEKIANSEREYRTVVNSLKEIVFRVDQTGAWTFLNPAWSNVTGYAIEESLGKNALHFVYPQDREEVACSFADLLEDRVQSIKLQLRFNTTQGEFRWIDLYAQRECDENDRLLGLTGSLSDITEQRNATEQLKENLSFIDALIETIPQAIYLKDVDGRYMRMNRAACELFGVTEAQMVGKTVFDLLPPDLAEFHHERDLKLYQERGTQNYEVMLNIHGRQVYTMYSKACLLRPDGSPRGLVGTIVDMSNQKAAERALLQAKEAAESASRSKSEFLANMSHEIRTPMNGIIGMTDLTLETELDRHQREYLEIVRSSADALLQIINDILDFSKIEAGKMTIEAITFDFNKTMLETLRVLSLRAQEKGLELALELDPEIPAFLIGDPGRIRQVLTNLVGNAIKFTERGEVVVRAAVKRLEQKLMLKISVTDSGIGIPKDKQQMIFEAFAQEDGSTTRRFGGTGLGLSITRLLVGMMGGEVTVESTVGVGSTFAVTLVLGIDHEAKPAQPLGDWRSLRGMRFMLVDDNQTNMTILRAIFARWSVETICQFSGEAALQYCQSAAEAPDCIVMDFAMPGMNGFETAAAISTHEKYAKTPIIMLSSTGMPGDATQSRKFGIQSYLLKPTTPDEILQAALSLIGGGRSQQQAQASAARLANRDPEQSLEIMLVEDNLSNQKLATALLKKWGHKVDVANNGQEALDRHEQKKYDIILMDLQMPVMGGFEATGKIREREAAGAPHTPVIAMTANALEGDREKCIAGGMDDYLSKPFKSDAFQAILKRYGPSATPAPQVNAEVVCSPDIPAVLGPLQSLQQNAKQYDYASGIATADQEIVLAIAEHFLVHAPEQIEYMRRAWKGKDLDSLQRHAHSMTGLFGNFNALPLQKISDEINYCVKANELDDIPALLDALDGGYAMLAPYLESAAKRANRLI
ncbi:PAS domain S-box protein [Massilia sp. W12]|uniref:PAS domain S-box protein n=1 Tax=Massilia sp. W12 TaxID=3126507 RepID=UPI0030CAE199